MTKTPRESSAHAQRTERIARNTGFLAAGQVISTVLGIVLASILGRTLGTDNFGIYYSIVTFTGFAFVFVDWGQTNYVVKEIAKGRTDQACFLGSAALIRTAILFLVAPISMLMIFLAGSHTLVVWLTPCVLIMSLPAIQAQLLNHYFRGKDRMDLDAASLLIARFVTVLATVIALQLGGGVSAAVLVPALGGLASLAFSYTMAMRLGLRFATPVGRTVQEAIVAGSAIFVLSLSTAIHPVFDVLLLSILTNPTVIGWLGAARAIIGILLAPALILSTASFPELCRVANSASDLRQVLATSSRLLLSAGALGFCGIYAFASTAITVVYGAKQFDQSADILMICAPFFPLFFLNFLIGNTAIAVGKSVSLAIAKSITVALSAIMGWFLISMFQAQYGNGALGIMLAFCLAELLMMVAFIAILPRGILAKEVWFNLLRAYLTAGIVLLLFATLGTQAAIWIAGPFLILSFLVVSLLTGLTKIDDIRVILHFARSKLFRDAGLKS